MNQDLVQAINYYTTKPHKDLSDLLISKSKDNLISMLVDLLTQYFNDKNSSSLREFITVSIAGYQHNSEKLGYNGFKQSSEIDGKSINCEAKPVNIRTDGYNEKKTKTKFKGGGSFNDYTIERLTKDIETNPNILSSGFIDGRLLYIVEFPFDSIAERLIKKVPADRKKGQYLRSGANFDYNHWCNSNKIRIIYSDKNAIMENEKYFARKFYNFLLEV